VLFPEFARFGMALESMWDWEDWRLVWLFLEPVFVPVCMGVISGCKSRSFWGRRMSTSILGVAAMNSIVFSCRKCKEKALCRLLNT